MDVKGTKVRMQIWDTAGQCRFRNITKTYFLGSSAVIFVYSIDDERSYEDVVSWIEQADEHSDNADQVRLLLGNKCDLEGENRKISRKQGE